jgi:hypothetical protein
LVGLVAAIGWRHYATGRPSYALAQIALAVKQHDATKLAYYADLGAFSDQVVGETVDWLASQHRLDGAAGAANARESDRRARIRDTKSTLSIHVNRNATNEILAYTSDSESVTARLVDAFIDQPPLAEIIDGDHFDLRSVDQAEIDDGTARVGVTLRHRELYVDVKLDLLLARDGVRWRLTGVEGLSHALSVIDNAQQEKLSIANRPREEALATTINLGAPTLQKVVAHRRDPPVYRLRLPITNRSTTTVSAISLALWVRGSDSDHPTMLAVNHDIAPQFTSGEIWQLDEATAHSTHVIAALSRPERLVFKVRSMVVDSGGQADTVRTLTAYGQTKRSRGD